MEIMVTLLSRNCHDNDKDVTWEVSLDDALQHAEDFAVYVTSSNYHVQKLTPLLRQTKQPTLCLTREMDALALIFMLRSRKSVFRGVRLL
jgi:hypothetical protein